MARHRCGIVRNETGLKGCKRVRVAGRLARMRLVRFRPSAFVSA